MNLTIRRSVEVQRTARILQLEGLFDIAPSQRSEQTWTLALPLEEQPWQIGLVVGPSGSGKTTLASEAWPDAPFVSVGQGYDWPADRAVVDGFPADLSVKDVTAALSSVGFSTPPAWLRPFRCLSTGEQFRATVARALLDPAPLVVLDEFTSVVDRTVAQVGSAAVGKAVRRTPGKRVVCVTCHADVEVWLCPDWVVTMPTGEFARRTLRRHPPVELEVFRVDKAAWDLFKTHHYLDASLHRAAKCFLALVAGRPAAFASVLHSPGRGGGWWREHRTVCLPDFQGVGIGNALSAFVAGVMRATGKRYLSTTGNPAMIRHRARSPLWKMLRAPGRVTLDSNARRGRFTQAVLRTRATGRVTAGFEYVGPADPGTAKALGVW